MATYRTIEQEHRTDAVTVDTLREFVAACDRARLAPTSHVTLWDRWTDGHWEMQFKVHGEVILP